MTMKLLKAWYDETDKSFANPSACKGAQINVEVGEGGTVNAFYWKGPKPSKPIPLTERFNILDADIGNEIWFESVPADGFAAVTKKKSLTPSGKKAINLVFEFIAKPEPKSDPAVEAKKKKDPFEVEVLALLKEIKVAVQK